MTLFPKGTSSFAVGFMFAQLGLHLIERAKLSRDMKSKEYAIGVTTLLSVPAIYPATKFLARRIVPLLFAGSRPSRAEIIAGRIRIAGFLMGVAAYFSGLKLHEHMDLSYK